MTGIPFFQVDAFAERALTGNPAAIMPLNRWLPDEVMQAIAAENNLAETAFLVPADREDARHLINPFVNGPTIIEPLLGEWSVKA